MDSQTLESSSAPDGATNPLARQCTFAIDIREQKKMYETCLRRLSRTLRIPGFRAGKAPIRLLEQDYGEEAEQESLSELTNQALRQAEISGQFVIASIVGINEIASDNPAERKFSATFEIYPQVALADLSQLSIERPVVEITAADIDEQLQEIQMEQGSYKTVERAAELDDLVVVSYFGTLDGAPLPDDENLTDYEMVLGETIEAWQAFDAEIVGMKAGESKVFHFTYPEDHESEALANKKVQIHLTLSEIKTWVPAEIDTEFLMDNGIADGDLDKLRAEIKEDLERKAEKTSGKLTRQRVFDALLDAHTFAVPEKLVEKEIRKLQQEDHAKMARIARILGADENTFSASDLHPPDFFADTAQRNVRLNLILDEINAIHEFRVTPAQVRARMEKNAQGYHHPEKTIARYNAAPKHKDLIAAELLEEQIVDWLLTKINVVDVPCDHKALIKMNIEAEGMDIPLPKTEGDAPSASEESS
ncbi:MAG: trigger factor [Candidatus Accumulibacter sp.]|jgi:trigger factor|nr:trigger factor [Accumulibacter sp.]